MKTLRKVGAAQGFRMTSKERGSLQATTERAKSTCKGRILRFAVLVNQVLSIPNWFTREIVQAAAYNEGAG
jgi:hypothetical protein